MSTPGKSIFLPAWRCACVRCGVTTEARCSCPPYEAGGDVRTPRHLEGCEPPDRCPNRECRAPRYWEEPRWKRGEGTSRETVRRRRIQAEEEKAARARKRQRARIG
jgi:hypothetical protein